MSPLTRLALRPAAMTRLGRRCGLDRAYRSECYRRFLQAKEAAERSLDRRDLDTVGRAYRAFLRSGLRQSERDRLEREDEIARLVGENARLRALLANRGAS